MLTPTVQLLRGALVVSSASFRNTIETYKAIWLRLARWQKPA
jgi:hypothetical protein